MMNFEVMRDIFGKKMEIDIAFDHCEQTQSITNTIIHSTVEPTNYGHSIKWSHLLRP